MLFGDVNLPGSAGGVAIQRTPELRVSRAHEQGACTKGNQKLTPQLCEQQRWLLGAAPLPSCQRILRPRK